MRSLRSSDVLGATAAEELAPGRNRSRFAVVALVGALILALGLMTTSGIDRAGAASGGPVVLMGIDAEDGGHGGHGPITVYEDVVNSVLDQAAEDSGEILVVGGGKSSSDYVTNFWDRIDADLSNATVTYVNGAPNISSQRFSGFEMIAVASSVRETSSGGLTQEENDALAGRQADIADFVNGGNGLLGFSQSGFTSPYRYAGGLGNFSTTVNQSYDAITPTQEGMDIGITDALDVCCWHDYYDNFPPFMRVLARDANNDRVAAIGAANVVIGIRTSDFGLPRNENPSSVGDPINLTTGNAYDYKQDLFVPGRGVPLQFVRFYNSQDSYSGPLGYGWTHAYNTSLEVNEDDSVTEMDPQGARLTFRKNGDGSYASPMGIHDTLTRDSNGAFVLRKMNGMEWRFDSSGELQGIADPNGNALSFSYDADGRLQKITDAVGRDTTLAYDSSGRITRITDPAGREVHYGYSAGGDLASVTDPSGSVTRYEYDASHNLTKTTNPNGGTTTFTYDDQDRAVSSESDGGHQKITLDYQSEEGRTLVTDSKGNESAFYYDVYQRVTRIVDPYGEEILYGWDNEGNKSSVTDQLGNTTRYKYDDRGNLTKMIQPKPTDQATANPTTTMTYEPDFNRVTSVTDPEGGITRHAYDAKGNLTRTTDALGNRATFEYDANGQLTQSTDPKGNATTYAYDAAGNPAGITDPAGKTTGFAYGGAGSLTSLLGLPSSVTDPLGRATKFSYDAMGRVTRTTNPDGSTARTRYDAMGNVTGVTNERGNTWRSAYDPLGRLSSETDPLGNKTLYEYDTEGNLTGLTDPAGTKTTYVYDKVRRLLTESTPSGGTNADGTPRLISTRFAYDAAGRMLAQTDPKGQTTRFAYDAVGRMTDVTDVATGGSTILQTATYEYDLLGRMTRAINPNGHASTYAYDELGHLTQETDPLGKATTYAYDPNGNLESRRDALGRTTGYSYDVVDRLTNTAHPDGSSIKRTYNAVGNLTRIADKTGTTRYVYDARDRLTKETLPGNMTLAYGYDPASNRTSLTNPDGKKTIFAYDAADRMTAVTDYAGAGTTYAYNALDLPTRVSYPSGGSERYAYDPLGRMTRATATGKNGAGAAVTLSRLSYAYDENSNPVSITDKDGNRSTFAYDALDRLTSETHPDRTLSYTYDPAGNRESRVRTDPSGGETTDYSYDDAERMTQAGQTTFSYDENGNMTSRRTSNGATTNYAYDFEDQLVQAGTKTYTRDAFGRAVSSKDGATTTGYLFDGEEVIQEKTGTSAPITYTRGLQDQPVSRRAGTNTPTYYHHDAIGSVVALSNSAGKPADTYSYTAFGIMREHTGTSTQPFMYVGNAYDPSTKLYDFHARMYDPAVGRFLSQDPVAGHTLFPQTLNPYAYGINNPLAQPDPNGELVPLVAAGLAVAAIGAGGLINGGLDAYEAARGGGSFNDIAKAGFTGIVAGTAGTAAGIGAGWLFKSPLAGYSFGGAVSGIVTSVLKDSLSGNTCFTEVVTNASNEAAAGFAAGPVGRVAGKVLVPLKAGANPVKRIAAHEAVSEVGSHATGFIGEHYLNSRPKC